MEKIIDLHIHTTKSDGALTPMEVVEEAEKQAETMKKKRTEKKKDAA